MKKYFNIFIRYLIIILFAFSNLYLFYLIFTPLTVYPVYFLLKLFFNVSLSQNTLIINSFSIKFIKACIAGAAYYFLFVLNMSVPEIKLKKRLKLILFSFSFLLFLNIIRIIFLSLLLFFNVFLFEITHKIMWYLLSTFFVVLIWFLEVKIFKIKQIPFYSDFKFLYKKSIFKSKK